jgi:hypothetical protein
MTMRFLFAFALVACSSKSDAPTTGSGSAGGAVVAPADAAMGPPVPLGADGLPIVCGDWKAAIDKLATCAALPQNARVSLIEVYKEASAGWGQLPADAKKNLVAICKAGADSVLKGAKATCSWP